MVNCKLPLSSTRLTDRGLQALKNLKNLQWLDLHGTEVTDQELLRRKLFLEFRDEDVAKLASINDLAQRYADSVIDEFYKHLLAFDETRSFFRDPEVLRRVKNVQQQYFLELTDGKYDLAYAQNRLRVGAIHERVGLPIKAYLGMYNYYLRAVGNRLNEAFQKEPNKAWEAFLSLMKLTFLIQRY